MFGRKESPESDKGHPENGPESPKKSVTKRPGAKNAPTPTRKEAQAARRRPLVAPDRKEARREARAHARAEKTARREAIARGEESALPERDKGPIKRFIRNSVDARFNIGEILLPLMLIVLAFMFIQNPVIQFYGIIFVWVILLAGGVDTWRLWRRTKHSINERFRQDPPKGSAFYLVSRAFQMRRGRIPAPQINRGDPIP